MTTYEVVFKIKTLRRAIIEASDEDEATDRFADELTDRYDLADSELDWLGTTEVSPKELREDEEA